jgi:hypothetical protein
MRLEPRGANSTPKDDGPMTHRRMMPARLNLGRIRESPVWRDAPGA